MPSIKQNTRWHCECSDTPCVGLDCGVYLPGRAPRKRIERAPEQQRADRALAWTTRRAKYGQRGHNGSYRHAVK